MNEFLINQARRALRSVPVLLFLLLTASPAFATHYAAADINVRYIGPKPGEGASCVPSLTYEVNITIYIACEGGSDYVSDQYDITSASGCGTGFTGRSLRVISVDTVHQLCPQFANLNSCKMGGMPFPYQYPGYRKTVMRDTVSLPASCPDWVFSWQDVARNDGITNLATKNSLYIAAGLNTDLGPTNSTPVFSSEPTPFYCVNQPSIFLNGPLDVDGNTIQVVPITSQNTNGTPNNYAPGYSATNPVNSPTGYDVNPNTGTTRFVAPLQGLFVLAFRASDYDSAGRLLSWIDRDVQVAALPCSGTPPDIDSLPLNPIGGTLVSSGAAGNIINVCPGNTLSFNVGGNSTTPTAALGLSVDTGNLTGSTLTVTGTGTPSINGVFQWTPTERESGRQYTLIFTTTDSSCNASGQAILQKNYLTVLLRVPPGIEAGPDGFYCTSPGSDPYPISVFSPDPNTSYSWSVLPGGDSSSLSCYDCPDPLASPDVTTTYVVTAQQTPFLCKNVDTITVQTNRVVALPAREIVLCKPGFVQLDAQAYGITPYEEITCGSNNFAECATLTNIGIGNCTDSSEGVNNQTPFNTAAATSRLQMIFQRGELRTMNMGNSTIRRIGFFLDSLVDPTVMNDFKILMKCTQSNTFNNGQSFETGTTQVYQEPAQGGLVYGWNYFDLQTPYNWDTSQNLLVEVCFANPSIPAGANLTPVRYSATAGNSVLMASAATGNLCLTVPTSTLASRNRPNIQIEYCNPSRQPFRYRWRPGTYMQDSNRRDPLVYVPHDMRYYVEAIGLNDCVVTDSVDIKVVQDTLYVTPIDSLICPGDVAILQASPRESYQWFQGDNFDAPTTLDCPTCARVVARPTEDTRYYVVGFNTYGNTVRVTCPDTVSATVRLKEPAVVQITPKNQTITYGQQATLAATGGVTYTWTPGNGSINTNAGPVIVATPLANTTYIVTGIGENGCQDSDTATVQVDASTAVFIPTAFSPNGDTRNDYFNVMNLTTQRITEFRIFNRWGNEVFYSNSNQPGWDGTYQGTAQPTGTYTYLIRMSSPDGRTQTFKGDLTLVR